MQRADSLEKTLILGKIEGRRRSRWQRMRWVDGFADSMALSLSKLQETVKDREVWCAEIHEVIKGQTWLSNWTTTNVLSWRMFYVYLAEGVFCVAGWSVLQMDVRCRCLSMLLKSSISLVISFPSLLLLLLLLSHISHVRLCATP